MTKKMPEHFVKVSYTEFDPELLDKFTYLGYMDELFPIEEFREQIKRVGWGAMFDAVKDQLKEEGVIDIFFVLEEEINKIRVYEKGDILKIIEGDNV